MDQGSIAEVTWEFVPRYGVVILVDSLGTKGILASRTPEVVFSAWREVVALFEDRAAAVQADARGLCSNWAVHTFSDTIMITLEGQRETLEGLVLLAAPVIFGPFYTALLRGVYLRGVVSAGMFYQEGTKIVGPAIDEASEWYEKSDWIGISATPTSERYLEFLADKGEEVDKFFVHYQVPLKSGATWGWALAWPKLAVALNDLARRAVLQAFARHSDSINVAAAPKYRNTLDFFDRTAG